MNELSGKKLPSYAEECDGSTVPIYWDRPIVSIEQYEQIYGKIATGMAQLKDSFRVWKKVLLLVDPSQPVWKRNPGAEMCHFADILPGIMEFGVAELIIPAGALVYHDTWMEVTSAIAENTVNTDGITDRIKNVTKNVTDATTNATTNTDSHQLKKPKYALEYDRDSDNNIIDSVPRLFRTNIAYVANIVEGCGISVTHAKSIYGKSQPYSINDIDYIVGQCAVPGSLFDSPAAGLYASGIHFTDSFDHAWAI
jgi:hypothetical protein